MLTVGICDDEPSMLAALSEKITGFFAEEGWEIRPALFSGGQALLDYPPPLDVVFLDIRMARPTGLETAALLRRRGFRGILVFVTVLRECVFDAFESHPFDYLVKPLDDERFRRTMERLSLALRDGEEKRLLVCRRDRQTLVPFREVAFCEVLDRKVYLHLRDGSVVDYYEKLDALAEKLDRRFFRCHRSYLVNLAYLAQIREGTAYLTTGEAVPVARGRGRALSQALMDHLSHRGEDL